MQEPDNETRCSQATRQKQKNMRKPVNSQATSHVTFRQQNQQQSGNEACNNQVTKHATTRQRSMQHVASPATRTPPLPPAPSYAPAPCAGAQSHAPARLSGRAADAYRRCSRGRASFHRSRPGAWCQRGRGVRLRWRSIAPSPKTRGISHPNSKEGNPKGSGQKGRTMWG